MAHLRKLKEYDEAIEASKYKIGDTIVFSIGNRVAYDHITSISVHTYRTQNAIETQEDREACVWDDDFAKPYLVTELVYETTEGYMVRECLIIDVVDMEDAKAKDFITNLNYNSINEYDYWIMKHLILGY